MAENKNPALQYVKEVKSFTVDSMEDLKPAVELLSDGSWIAMSAAGSKDGSKYLIMLGKVSDVDSVRYRTNNAFKGCSFCISRDLDKNIVEIHAGGHTITVSDEVAQQISDHIKALFVETDVEDNSAYDVPSDLI